MTKTPSRKKPGRPVTTGSGIRVTMRLQADELAALENFRKTSKFPTRAHAAKVALRIALGMEE